MRGTPQQIIDKYNQLARDATLSNDRVAAENFQQHAEHYTRMLGEAQREQEAKRAEQEAQQKQAREARQAREDEANERRSQQEAPPAEPQPVSEPAAAAGTGDQPDVIDVHAAGDAGLVPTPEDKPKPKRTRTRRPAKKAEPATEAKDSEPAAAPSETDGPQAAE